MTDTIKHETIKENVVTILSPEEALKLIETSHGLIASLVEEEAEKRVKQLMKISEKDDELARLRLEKEFEEKERKFEKTKEAMQGKIDDLREELCEKDTKISKLETKRYNAYKKEEKVFCAKDFLAYLHKKEEELTGWRNKERRKKINEFMGVLRDMEGIDNFDCLGSRYFK